MNLTTIFALLVIYQLKHFIADYPLQANQYMLGKFKPGWDFLGPLSCHAAVHGVLTWMIAIGMTHDIRLAGTLMCFDATVHFCMDRIKAGPKYMGRWKPVTGKEYVELQEALRVFPRGSVFADLAYRRLRSNTLFWWSLGFDQMVHHLTHYACIYVIVKGV